jgi:hypothetical protein
VRTMSLDIFCALRNEENPQNSVLCIQNFTFTSLHVHVLLIKSGSRKRRHGSRRGRRRGFSSASLLLPRSVISRSARVVVISPRRRRFFGRRIRQICSRDGQSEHGCVLNRLPIDSEVVFGRIL